MESSNNTNRETQHLVRRGGCDTKLRTVKGYEDQITPVVSMEGGWRSQRKNSEEESQNSISLPWIKRFNTETLVDPQAASTILSQLNNYHCISSITGEVNPTGDDSSARNKVTPPSGALKHPREMRAKRRTPPIRKHPGDPPPLLLAESNILATSICRSTSNITTTDRVLSLPTKKGVPHIYHDHSNVPDIVGVVRKKTGGVTKPFPEKLHEMLDNDDDPSIVSWLPHGRAFLVRKSAEFTAQIMPKYFRQTKLTSFQRQLNLYGFRRLTQGADSGAYYHELFLRGRPQLCFRMQRQKIKGTGHKQPADAQTEPNFYNMVPSKRFCETRGIERIDLSNEGLNTTATVHTDTKEKRQISSSFRDLSPGSRGAATLLTDMKITHCNLKGRSLLDLNFPLDQFAISSTVSLNGSHQSNRTLSPTSSLSTTQSSHPGNSPTSSSSNVELYVTKQRSMSLLGRVQSFHKPFKMKSSSPSIFDSSSAFFWPPQKETISSPSHTAATFESSIISSPSPMIPYLQTDSEGTKKPKIIDQQQKTRPLTDLCLSVENELERNWKTETQRMC